MNDEKITRRRFLNLTANKAEELMFAGGAVILAGFGDVTLRLVSAQQEAYGRFPPGVSTADYRAAKQRVDDLQNQLTAEVLSSESQTVTVDLNRYPGMNQARQDFQAVRSEDKLRELRESYANQAYNNPTRDILDYGAMGAGLTVAAASLWHLSRALNRELRAFEKKFE